MVRYATQPDLWGCGPTAILNVLKWCGSPATLKKDYERLKGAVKWESDCGCTHPDFDKCLREEGRNLFAIRGVSYPTIGGIETHLRKKNCAVVISSIWQNKKTGEEVQHVALLIGVSESGKSFTVVNIVKGKTIKLIRRATLLKSLRKRIRDSSAYAELLAPVPFAWFLTKIKK